MAEFIDFRYRESEESINEVLDIYAAWKGTNSDRVDFLNRISVLKAYMCRSFTTPSITATAP